MLIIISPTVLHLLNYRFYAVNFTIIHNISKRHQITGQISLLESNLPHQYDFNDFQFHYKGVPGQALLTETRYFFVSRGINATLHLRYAVINSKKVWKPYNLQAAPNLQI